MIGIKIYTFPTDMKINFTNKYIPEISGIVYYISAMLIYSIPMLQLHCADIPILLLFNKSFDLLQYTCPTTFLLGILKSLFAIGNFCKISLRYNQMCFTVFFF